MQGAVDGNPKSGWAIMPEFNKNHSATFEFAEALAVEPSARIAVRIVQHHDETHQLGRFRVLVTDGAPPFEGSKLPPEIAALVNIARDQRTAEQQQKLTDYYLALDPEFARLTKVLEVSSQQSREYRLTGVQDLAWALINTPAFLFNR